MKLPHGLHHGNTHSQIELSSMQINFLVHDTDMNTVLYAAFRRQENYISLSNRRLNDEYWSIHYQRNNNNPVFGMKCCHISNNT